MEKSEGRCIFRGLQEEEAAKKEYENKKSNKMEALYNSIQKQFDNKKNLAGLNLFAKVAFVDTD